MSVDGAEGGHDVRVRVALASGAVEVPAIVSVPDEAIALVAVAPGAGAGREHPFLRGFADGLHAEGLGIMRFDFPYRVAGRRMPGPAAHAVTTWQAIERAAAAYGLPFWAGGKSYGGRMASMAAAERVIDPAGLVYLGYPLHPPGRPDRLRAAHLPAIAAPQLFVEGTADPFVSPLTQLEEAVGSCPDAEVVWIEGAGHSFEIAGRRHPADEIGRSLAGIVAEGIRRRM